jgi:hypothetical protein
MNIVKIAFPLYVVWIVVIKWRRALFLVVLLATECCELLGQLTPALFNDWHACNTFWCKVATVRPRCIPDCDAVYQIKMFIGAKCKGHTNILLGCGCRSDPVGASLDAVSKSKRVVIVTEYGATCLLNSTDGALGGTRGRNVDWGFEFFATL